MPEPSLVMDDAASKTRVKCLEQVLQYFHVACKDAVAALPDEKARAAFLANVDVATVAAISKHTEKDQYVKGMRQATWRWVGQLESATGKKMPQATPAWLLRGPGKTKLKNNTVRNNQTPLNE